MEWRRRAWMFLVRHHPDVLENVGLTVGEGAYAYPSEPEPASEEAKGKVRSGMGEISMSVYVVGNLDSELGLEIIISRLQAYMKQASWRTIPVSCTAFLLPNIDINFDARSSNTPPLLPPPTLLEERPQPPF
ncbi:hypothetical protein BDQ17DRAFT_1424154 [Cyathus striatus]|nr:hypothetical protein BDQ17DRAFT_1424154 [Cyathus striatus]